MPGREERQRDNRPDQRQQHVRIAAANDAHQVGIDQDGDIIGPAELAGDFQSALDNEYGIREELGMIDLNEVLTPFFN